MRNWLFHPLLFYPLVALAALAVVGLSVRPQSWPRAPAPVAGEVRGGVLVLERDAFNSPENGPHQSLNVSRDFWGKAETLHVAVMPGQAEPTADPGVRVLVGSEGAQILRGGAVTVEVHYRPQPVNTATGLAVSLQGGTSPVWVTQPMQPQAGVLRYALPADPGATAIGLRAISTQQDQLYGVEIVRIVAYPTRAPIRGSTPQDSQPPPAN